MFSRGRVAPEVAQGLGLNDRVISVFLPIKTRGGLNAREHWAVRARRNKREKELAWLLCPKVKTPVRVTLTRCGTHTLDDDNLAGVLKSIRDGICLRLGVDDGDTASVRFSYQQEKTKRVASGVRIELECLT